MKDLCSLFTVNISKNEWCTVFLVLDLYIALKKLGVNTEIEKSKVHKRDWVDPEEFSIILIYSDNRKGTAISR